jgi:hypothetical protein
MLHSADRVRDLAYTLWEQHGRPSGRDLELWLQAERQLSVQGPANGVAGDVAPTPKRARKPKRK